MVKSLFIDTDVITSAHHNALFLEMEVLRDVTPWWWISVSQHSKEYCTFILKVRQAKKNGYMKGP